MFVGFVVYDFFVLVEIVLFIVDMVMGMWLVLVGIEVVDVMGYVLGWVLEVHVSDVKVVLVGTMRKLGGIGLYVWSFLVSFICLGRVLVYVAICNWCMS